ncbi:MAG: potassium channel family protein [Ekhidna sp.]
MFILKTIRNFLMDKEYRDLLYTMGGILILGTFVYHRLEGWSYLDAFYFSFITLTTIGFGDFAPQTDGGKLFTIIYIMMGVGIILGFVNAVYHHYSKEVRQRKKLKSRKRLPFVKDPEDSPR